MRTRFQNLRSTTALARPAPGSGLPGQVWVNMADRAMGFFNDAGNPIDLGYLPLAGGTMTGFLLLSASPTALLHAATKGYVDAGDAAIRTDFAAADAAIRTDFATVDAALLTNINTRLPLAGGSLSGFLTLHANPAAFFHAASKGYVDTAIAAIPLPPIPVPPVLAQIVTASATPVVLTAASPDTLIITGSGSQAVTLPALGSVDLGRVFTVVSANAAAITVDSFTSITAGMTATFTALPAAWQPSFTGGAGRRGTGDALFASAPTIASPVFTGLPLFPAGAAGGASMRLPQGVAPTTPVDGDVWTTSAGVFARINGVTVNLTDLGPAPPAFATTAEARAGVRADVVMSPALSQARSGEIEAVATSATVLNMSGIPEEATELDVQLFFGQVGTTAYSVSLRLLNIALAYTSHQIVTTVNGATTNVENPETGFIVNSTGNVSLTGFISLKRFNTRWFADGRMRVGNGNAARSNVSLSGWSDNILTPMTSVRWLGSGNFTGGSARCKWRI